MAKRKAPATEQDPTLRTVEVEIAAKKYTLCFDYRSLALARAHFRSQGISDVNLMVALTAIDLDTISVIFPCAIHRFHPEIKFEQAQAMLTIPTAWMLSHALVGAWRAAMPDPEKEAPAGNPPQSS